MEYLIIISELEVETFTQNLTVNLCLLYAKDQGDHGPPHLPVSVAPKHFF